MTRRRASWAALVGVLALTALAPAHGEAVHAAPLAPGVTHEVWPVQGSSARVHVARVAAGAPVQLQVAQAAGGLAGGRETTTALCRRTRGCVVALNGDFFTAEGPVGAVVVDGRMLRSPHPGHEQLSVAPLRATGNGFGEAGWGGSVSATQGEPVPLDGVNVALGPGQVVVYTSEYGAATPPCACTELVLAEGPDRVGRLDRPVEVTATGRGTGQTPLPPGTVVVAGEGAGAARVTALADATHASPEARRLAVTLAVAQPTQHNLGAHPVLLRDGQVLPVDEADPMLAQPHPRSIVAWKADGTVWLLAFDGRQPTGPGPTWRDVVAFLQRLGATEAVMLDGGGSTTLARAQGPLNIPSDGAERPVSNAVVLVAEPSALPPAPPVAAAAAAPAQVVPAQRAPAPPPPPAPRPALAAAPAPAPPRATAVPVAAPAVVFARAGAARAAVEHPVAAPVGGTPRRLAAPPAPASSRGHPVAVPVAAALVLLAAAAWPHAARTGWAGLTPDVRPSPNRLPAATRTDGRCG